MIDQLVTLIVDYTKMHFLELFTSTLIKAIPVAGDRLAFFATIFESLVKSK